MKEQTADNLKRFEDIDFSSRLQKYVNVESHQEAMDAGATYVQLKYDGWWARLVVENGVGKVYSRQNQLKHTQETNLPDCVLIGEFLKGTQRVVSGTEGDQHSLIVFDILNWEGLRVDNQSYKSRMDFLGLKFGDNEKYGWVKQCCTYPIEQADLLWEQEVENGNCEGLVYKYSKSHYIGSKVWRRKREFTMDYVVMKMYEGNGKHGGRLGGLICGLYENGKLVEKVRVGGGFNDEERDLIWQSPAFYYDRVLEVKGWQVFDSGALRHPNAVRGKEGKLKWRDDKRPVDCKWPL